MNSQKGTSDGKWLVIVNDIVLLLVFFSFLCIILRNKCYFKNLERYLRVDLNQPLFRLLKLTLIFSVSPFCFPAYGL